jgi:toxin ParE1/3/4
MKGRVLIRPRAAADLAETYDYLAARNAPAANRFADAAKTAFDRLAEVPGMGAVRRTRNPALRGLRSWPVGGSRNYIVFYIPMLGGGIDVIRVYHGARNLGRLLDEEQ